MKTSLRFRASLAVMLAIAPFAAAQIAAAQTPAKKPTKGASWIAVRASLDKESYAVGEPIKVTLKATNIQSRDAYLKYSSGQRFELKLYKSGETESVYTWSASRSFMMMTKHIRLKEGESEVYGGEIGSEMGELAPGDYRLEAQLANSSQISAAPVIFSIAPRVTTTNVANMKLSATTDKSAYKVGENVQIDLTLENSADSPVLLDLDPWIAEPQSGQNYDVIIRDAAGEMKWRWSLEKQYRRVRRSMAARQAMKPEVAPSAAEMEALKASLKVTISAREKQDFSVQWRGYGLKMQFLEPFEITPGKYTVEAIYASIPPVRAAPIEIEIR